MRSDMLIEEMLDIEQFEAMQEHECEFFVLQINQFPAGVDNIDHVHYGLSVVSLEEEAIKETFFPIHNVFESPLQPYQLMWVVSSEMGMRDLPLSPAFDVQKWNTGFEVTTVSLVSFDECSYSKVREVFDQFKPTLKVVK